MTEVQQTDDFEEIEVGDELDDLEPVENWSDGAVLWSTDWTAETVLSQLRRGNINLDPIFQRRSAWTRARQSLFIESLILGLPIPQLILAEDPKKKGAFIVIDGKQRLLALRAFAADENDDFRPLSLYGLEELGHLNRKSYSHLRGDETLSGELVAFENSSIRTVIIRNWKSESYLYEVFLRINTGSVRLSPQELRQALHPGEFSRFVDIRSADSEELQKALGLTKPDFRMRDAELLLRYLSYSFFSNEYNGNLKVFLDNTTRNLNALWLELNQEIERRCEDMEAALAFCRRAFGDKDYLRKWNGREFERQKNRAVMDIMLFFFSDSTVRAASEGKEAEIVDNFKRLCAEDQDFRAALETTTKSVEANAKRFSAWAETLERVVGMSLPSPFNRNAVT